MAFLKEFKEFALKGNVMDMAVGVIIGGAFGKIVSSLVNDMLMPPIPIKYTPDPTGKFMKIQPFISKRPQSEACKNLCRINPKLLQTLSVPVSKERTVQIWKLPMLRYAKPSTISR